MVEAPGAREAPRLSILGGSTLSHHGCLEGGGTLAVMETGLDDVNTDGATGTGGTDRSPETPAPVPGDAGTPEIAIDRVDQLLDEVELALARLDDRTYGQCVACGAVIDDARLAAEPTVQTCGTCGAAPAPGPASTAAVSVLSTGPDPDPEVEQPSGPPLD